MHASEKIGNKKNVNNKKKKKPWWETTKKNHTQNPTRDVAGHFLFL